MIIRKINRRRKRPKPPGPWGIPAVGHLPVFEDDLPKTFGKLRQQYGDVFKIRIGSIGSWDTVVINRYSAIKDSLEKCGDVFSSRPNFLIASLLIKERNGGGDNLSFGKFTPATFLIRPRSFIK